MFVVIYLDVNALLLTLVVDAHVSDDAKAKLSDLGELISKFSTSLFFSNEFVELSDSISAEERFDSSIAKCDVDESLEQVT